jgi:(2Fe-2S) ferredoxin
VLGDPATHVARYRVYVCHNTTCKSRGAGNVWRALRRELHQAGAEAEAELVVATCQGRCEFGPNLTVHPGATKYRGVTSDDAAAIVHDHLLGGESVERLIFREC